MKPVAPYPFLEKRIRQRKGLIDLRRGSVESGVETRDLRQVRIEGHGHLDRREIVRLVQRCERHQSLELGQQFRSDPGGPGVAQPAMDHAVADCRKPPVAEPVPCPRQYGRQDLARHSRRFRTQIRGRDLFAVGPGSACRRTHADPIDLPAKNPLLALVKAELERGGAGVDHADQRLCSRRHAAALRLRISLRAGKKFVAASEICLLFIKNLYFINTLRAQTEPAQQRNSWRPAGNWQRKCIGRASTFVVSRTKQTYAEILLPRWQLLSQISPEDVVATIDINCVAGHRARIGACEKNAGGADLLDGHQPARRRALGDPRHQRVEIGDARGGAGGERAGADRRARGCPWVRARRPGNAPPIRVRP